MLCPFQLNRSAQFPVHAVQSLLFEEATNRVNHVALTPFRVKVSLCLNIFKMLKVKSEAFSTKQLASINFVRERRSFPWPLVLYNSMTPYRVDIGY